MFSQIDGEACAVFALSIQPRHRRTIPYHVLCFRDNYSYLLRNLSAIITPAQHIMSETLNVIDHIANAPRLYCAISGAASQLPDMSSYFSSLSDCLSYLIIRCPQDHSKRLARSTRLFRLGSTLTTCSSQNPHSPVPWKVPVRRCDTAPCTICPVPAFSHETTGFLRIG